MSSVPEHPWLRATPVREDGTPILLSDYLNDAEMDRLAGLLIGLLVDSQERDRRSGAEQAAEPQPPAPKPKRRASRPSPSRLAKWEAAWQAEADAEADS